MIDVISMEYVKEKMYDKRKLNLLGFDFHVK